MGLSDEKFELRSRVSMIYTNCSTEKEKGIALGSTSVRITLSHLLSHMVSHAPKRTKNELSKKLMIPHPIEKKTNQVIDKARQKCKRVRIAWPACPSSND